MTKNQVDQPGILIVDDNAISRSMLRDYIEFHHPNWRVLEAENGKVGLEVAQLHQPQVILLDLCMPVMNGYEMALALRELPLTRPIPLVLCTGEDTSDPHIAILSPMCYEVLFKPFSFKQLETTLRAIITLDVSVSRVTEICPA